MAEEKRTLRAGGWVDRRDGHGWVLDTGPRPVPPPAQRPPVPQPEPTQPESTECPDCGKEVKVRKDGSLRKHTCVVDAPPPDVTFGAEDGEEQEDDDG